MGAFDGLTQAGIEIWIPLLLFIGSIGLVALILLTMRALGLTATTFEIAMDTISYHGNNIKQMSLDYYESQIGAIEEDNNRD